MGFQIGKGVYTDYWRKWTCSKGLSATPADHREVIFRRPILFVFLISGLRDCDGIN